MQIQIALKKTDISFNSSWYCAMIGHSWLCQTWLQMRWCPQGSRKIFITSSSQFSLSILAQALAKTMGCNFNIEQNLNIVCLFDLDSCITSTLTKNIHHLKFSGLSFSLSPNIWLKQWVVFNIKQNLNIVCLFDLEKQLVKTKVYGRKNYLTIMLSTQCNVLNSAHLNSLNSCNAKLKSKRKWTIFISSIMVTIER